MGHLTRAVLLAARARLAQKTGDVDLAEFLHRWALRLWHQLGELRRVTEHIEALGMLAVRHDASPAVATLLAASERLRELQEQAARDQDQVAGRRSPDRAR